ncbi:MAG: lipopolysaccharide transport periplasmic protein LptA [Candidatus Thioglobus sp.]|nr:lipopolysaccharide transport periplasmic protein LptA [Candidatus Thioglobus sp.]
MNKVFLRVFLVILGLLSCTVFAAKNDAKQAIQIQANTVVIDEKTGLSTYSGNAKVVHGSLVLSAQNIYVFSAKDEVTKIVAKGSKNQHAYYKQNQPNQPRFIEAKALKIVYFVSKELMYLEGKAHLVQGFNSFTGGTLEYDAKTDRVLIKKSSDGTQRVKFKIKL